MFPQVQPGDNNLMVLMHNCSAGSMTCYSGPNKKVLNVADGLPFNDKSLPAAGDYMWVLEMKTNCAKKLGIKRGTLILIPAGSKSGARTRNPFGLLSVKRTGAAAGAGEHKCYLDGLLSFCWSPCGGRLRFWRNKPEPR